MEDEKMMRWMMDLQCWTIHDAMMVDDGHGLEIEYL